MSHSRLRGFCFFGTFSPSRRHIPGSPQTGLRLWGGDPFHSILAHVPSRFLQLDGDASIAIAAISNGQREDSPGQRVFIVPLRRLVALRAAWLIHQLARMTLTCPVLPGMLHSGSPPIRA